MRRALAAFGQQDFPYRRFPGFTAPPAGGVTGTEAPGGAVPRPDPAAAPWQGLRAAPAPDRPGPSPRVVLPFPHVAAAPERRTAFVPRPANENALSPTGCAGGGEVASWLPDFCRDPVMCQPLAASAAAPWLAGVGGAVAAMPVPHLAPQQAMPAPQPVASPAVAPWLAALRDGSVAVARQQAMPAAQPVASPAVAPWLVALRDGPVAVARQEAVPAAQPVASPAVAPWLVALRDGPVAVARQEAAPAAQPVASPAVAPWLAALRDGPVAVARQEAAPAAQPVASPAVAPWLAALRDAPAVVARQEAVALPQAASPPAVAPWLAGACEAPPIMSPPIVSPQQAAPLPPRETAPPVAPAGARGRGRIAASPRQDASPLQDPGGEALGAMFRRLALMAAGARPDPMLQPPLRQSMPSRTAPPER
ncbi:hypothetical protein [Rhodovastum atsumiense]|nr:hypothetical protein [Rhodovastum atsumiense]